MSYRTDFKKATKRALEISDRTKPTCGRDDCDSSENPAHWIDIKHTPPVRAALRLVPDLVEALEAIQARRDGEWDHPALLRFGALSTSTEADINRILTAALKKAYKLCPKPRGKEDPT
jgi:hypothetical protein